MCMSFLYKLNGSGAWQLKLNLIQRTNDLNKELLWNEANFNSNFKFKCFFMEIF